MNTLVDMISGMEVKEDDEDFLNAVDYMFKGLEQRKPDCFAVKQYSTNNRFGQWSGAEFSLTTSYRNNHVCFIVKIPLTNCFPKGNVGGVRRTAGLYKHCPFHGRWH